MATKLNKRKLLKKVTKILKNFNDLAWTSNNGVINIKELKDDHLLNTVCYLHRRIKSRKDLTFPDLEINGMGAIKWFKILRLEYMRRELSTTLEQERLDRLMEMADKLFEGL